MDKYLDQLEAPAKTELERIRQLIKHEVPDAKEVINYGLPGFKYKSKYFITFGSFKGHMSIFPGSHAVEVLGDKLGNYKISKGTIQFSLEQPLSDEIIKQLIHIRVTDIDEA